MSIGIVGGWINFVKVDKVFLYKWCLGFPINLTKVPQTKKTITVLNKLSRQYRYSYICNRFLSMSPLR